MKFQGQEIGKPTVEQLVSYATQQGFQYNIQDAIDYWDKKGWDARSVEGALNIFNSEIALYIKRVNKALKKTRKPKLKKTPDVIQRVGHEVAEYAGLKGKPLIQKIPKRPKSNSTPKDYNEQLTDERWYAFRRFIFAVRGYQCEQCGSKVNLQVHHPKYKPGRLAWEYTCNEVQVLCRECHKKEHHIEEVA